MCLPNDLLTLIKPLLPPNEYVSNQRVAQIKCRSSIVPALRAVSPAGSAELGVSAGGGSWMGSIHSLWEGVRCDRLHWWINTCNQSANDKHIKKSDFNEQVGITRGMIRGDERARARARASSPAELQRSVRSTPVHAHKHTDTHEHWNIHRQQWTQPCASRRFKNEI